MEDKPKISGEVRDKLRKPFPKEAYSKIESKSFLTSLKAAYVVERLNDVFGVGRWNYSHSVIRETDEQVLIKGQLIILDYDCIVPETYGSHKIVGKGVELADGYKSAMTDGLTKAASYVEIGHEVFKGLINPDGNYKNGFGKPENKPPAQNKTVDIKSKQKPEIVPDKKLMPDRDKVEKYFRGLADYEAVEKASDYYIERFEGIEDVAWFRAVNMEMDLRFNGSPNVDGDKCSDDAFKGLSGAGV